MHIRNVWFPFKITCCNKQCCAFVLKFLSGMSIPKIKFVQQLLYKSYNYCNTTRRLWKSELTCSQIFNKTDFSVNNMVHH